MPDDDRGLLARFALGLRLADADDRGKAGLQRRFGLGANEFVGLVMMRPTLRMSHDDVTRAGVLEHRGGNVAGESPARLGRAILSAEAELAPLDPPGGLRDQRRRRADEQLGGAGFARVGRRRIASISARDPERPFIFQLPATSGRTPGVMSALSAFSWPGCYHAPTPMQMQASAAR